MKFHPGHLHTFLMHEADGSPIHCQSVYTGSPLTMIEKVSERACAGLETLLHIRTARPVPFTETGLAHSSVWLRIEPMEEPPEIPQQQEEAARWRACLSPSTCHPSSG